VLVSIHLSKHYLELVDELVARGIYPSRSEAVRVAVRDFVLKEFSLLLKRRKLIGR